MSAGIQISKMTRIQKMQTMEALWDDRTRDERRFKSPSWHSEALQGAEAAIQAGTVKFTDWDKVKRKLRDLGT